MRSEGVAGLPGLADLFGRGFALLGRVGGLVLLVWVVDILRYFSEGVKSFPGFRMGIKFSLPFNLPSIENFYDFPRQTGFSVQLPFSPEMGPFFVLLLAIFPFLLALVTTFYLGVMNAVRVNRPWNAAELLRNHY